MFNTQFINKVEFLRELFCRGWMEIEDAGLFWQLFTGNFITCKSALQLLTGKLCIFFERREGAPAKKCAFDTGY